MTRGDKNIMVILSSPSGAGKTTITKKIQQKHHSFKLSVSHTTRKPRSNEVDGVDYHFTSKEEFERLINDGKFYEHAKIFGNYYGTLKKTVDETLKNNEFPKPNNFDLSKYFCNIPCAFFIVKSFNEILLI